MKSNTKRIVGLLIAVLAATLSVAQAAGPKDFGQGKVQINGGPKDFGSK